MVSDFGLCLYIINLEGFFVCFCELVWPSGMALGW